jgi:hypothetical protein
MTAAARHAGCPPGGAARLLAAAGLAIAAATAAAATTHASSPAEGGDAADAIESIDPAPHPPGLRWEISPRAARTGAPFEMPAAAPGAVQAFDYRLWIGNRRTEFGIGLPSSSPLVVALRHQISPQTRLIIDTELGRGSDPLTPWSRHRPFGVGLESSPLHGLAKGNLLRHQLSLHSSVALRLRGGRLGLFLHVRVSGD